MRRLPTSFDDGIRYYEAGPRSGQSENVVFIHGLGNSLSFWTRVAPSVARYAHVVAFDLPGFGSSRPPRGEFSLGSITDEVIHFLNRREIDRCRIVGHSLGAIVSMAVAIRQPSIVSKLVLIDGTLISVNKILSDPVFALRHPILAINVAAQFAGGLIRIDETTATMLAGSRLLRALFLWPFVASPTDVNSELLVEALMGNQGGLSVLKTLCAVKGVRSSDLMAQVAQPVDLLWGEKDRLIPDRDIVRARTTLKVERELALSNCGHWPMIEMSDAVVRFLTMRTLIPRTEISE